MTESNAGQLNCSRWALAYLAGPDVFCPDARERGVAKKALLASVGITGLYPLDDANAAS
jgi:nucleoside 2-deoxyribosyltransferase